MLKNYTCAGCSEPIEDSRIFVENDLKGNLRHFHTRDECFIKWYYKQRELDDMSVPLEKAHT